MSDIMLNLNEFAMQSPYSSGPTYGKHRGNARGDFREGSRCLTYSISYVCNYTRAGNRRQILGVDLWLQLSCTCI